MNLLLETLSVLVKNNKTVKDVLWVGCPEFKSSWENFEKIANIEYDEGYGAPEVATDLVIVGDGFWLERAEYDGSEWWEFKTMPKVPTAMKVIKALTVDQGKILNASKGKGWCGWMTLDELNGGMLKDD